MSEKSYKPRAANKTWEIIKVGDREIEVCRILIEANNYEVCDHYSFERWSNVKKGEWGAGLVNSKDDPRKVERVGLFGEIGIGLLFNQRIDLTYREGGDQFDFLLFGKTVNVKMRTESPPRHDRALIKCRHTADSHYMPLEHELYMFGFMDWEHERKASVCMVGGIYRENIDTSVEHPAYRGSHFNHEVHYRNMIPIRKLLEDYNNG